MKRKHNEGFTLVELLVSIVILAAIVIPTCTSLTLSYRMNAKTKELTQAQLAVSSTVEKLMAEGIDADRAKTVIDNNGGIYDFAWVDDVRSETDDYPGVTIMVADDDGNGAYFFVTVSDDEGLVTATTHIRKGGS